MDRTFFTSRYFVVSAIVAGLILAGAAAAYQYGGTRITSGHGCDRPALGGTPVALAPAESHEAAGERRTVTYRVPAGDHARGELVACSRFGDVTVDPSLKDEIEVTFVIDARSADAVRTTDVVAELREDGDTLRLGAWVARLGQGGTGLRATSAIVSLHVRLPEGTPWEIRASSDTGDIRAQGLRLAALDLRTRFGDVTVQDADLGGDAVLATETGHVVLGLSGVHSGTIDASSRFGNVELALPARADIGYDVDAASDFGEVTIRIGPTERYDSTQQGAGTRETARSVDYATKPTQVSVTGRTDTGDVRILTPSSP